jgi:hypothetical protein
MAGGNRLFIPCRQLPYCFLAGNVLIGVFPHTQHSTATILKSSIPSHTKDVSKSQFHNGIDFSQGIDSVESGQGAHESIPKNLFRHSKESIPPAYVAWWAGTKTPFLLRSWAP